MKKIFALLSVFLFTISSANAGILSPFASTFATIELGKSVMSNQSINSKFENSNDFFENLRQFEDIALGAHIRFGLLGVNLNWSQTTLKNTRLNGYNSLENSAKYKSDQIGIGAQVSPFGGDFIRLSAQRYIGKIGLLDTEYTTFRLGYLKSF